MGGGGELKLGAGMMLNFSVSGFPTPQWSRGCTTLGQPVVRRSMEDLANCKTRTHTSLLSRLSLLQTSPGTYLQVQVVGRHGNCRRVRAICIVSAFISKTMSLSIQYRYSCLFVCPSLPDCQSICLSACSSICLCQRPPSLSTAVFFFRPVDLCTTPPSTIHLPHLPRYLMHSWSTACICTHFVLHPFSINY